MSFPGSFGNWLRQRRKALDLTQAELADQVGCSVITIQKIEGDERRPSKQISERLADALVISPAQRPAFVAFARRTTVKSPSLAIPVQTAPGGNLPPVPSFIGRVEELAQIAEYLSRPECRLLTLVGVGGVGKTYLALQAAH